MQSQLKDGQKEFIQSLEIQDILLIESDHKIYSLYNGQKLSFNFEKVGDLNLIVEKDFVVFEIEAAIQIDDRDTEESLVYSKAKFASIYSFDKDKLVKYVDHIDDFVINFFQFSAITHIIAYAREYFYNIISRSGYPRLTVPLVKSLLDEDAEKAASEKLKQEENKSE